METPTSLSICKPHIAQCVGTRVTEGSPLLWGFAAGRLGLEVEDLFCIGFGCCVCKLAQNRHYSI